ncbi:hypothetical protein PMIN03_002042 [Paraphaeosphaeria minitans]
MDFFFSLQKLLAWSRLRGGFSVGAWDESECEGEGGHDEGQDGFGKVRWVRYGMVRYQMGLAPPPPPLPQASVPPRASKLLPNHPPPDVFDFNTDIAIDFSPALRYYIHQAD